MAEVFYRDGSGLPQLHPDSTINSQILIADLCAKLDVARVGLAAVLEMNVVTPAAVAMKSKVRWAMAETEPSTIGEEHHNCG
jgi:hypothetical protein